MFSRPTELWFRCRRSLRAPAALAALTLCLSGGAAFAQIPLPSVTGPVAAQGLPGNPAHNYPFFATNKHLAEQGYTEQEFFFSGTANRYNTTQAGETATVISGGNPYMTRMIVRAPADKRRFNGTVLVEWLNVTNGYDADNLWFFDWEHALANGYAWVGVSAPRLCNAVG
jgi:hypothetical protein